MSVKLRTAISIMGGLAAIILAGLILYPVLMAIMNKYFSLSSGYSVHKLIIDTALFAWNAIAGFAGGFVAALLAKSRSIFHALITGIAAFIILLLVTLLNRPAGTWDALLSGLGLLLFCIIGGLIQQKIALSKYETI